MTIYLFAAIFILGVALVRDNFKNPPGMVKGPISFAFLLSGFSGLFVYAVTESFIIALAVAVGAAVITYASGMRIRRKRQGSGKRPSLVGLDARVTVPIDPSLGEGKVFIMNADHPLIPQLVGAEPADPKTQHIPNGAIVRIVEEVRDFVKVEPVYWIENNPNKS